MAFQGEFDGRISSGAPAVIAAMAKLGKKFQSITYPKTTHSFVSQQNLGDNFRSLSDSWPKAIKFMKENTLTEAQVIETPPAAPAIPGGSMQGKAATAPVSSAMTTVAIVEPAAAAMKELGKISNITSGRKPRLNSSRLESPGTTRPQTRRRGQSQSGF